MLNYLYNSYLYEICHNYLQLLKNSIWQPQKRITYQANMHMFNPAYVGPSSLHISKLETIPEQKENTLSNFYYLSLFKESESTWSIHGLWPQTTTKSYPTYCHKVTFDLNQLEPILNKLEQYWYSNGGTLTLDEKFWQHEYEKHGSCVFTPMTEFEYFHNTLELYETAMELDLPSQFYNEKTKKCLIPVNQELAFITE